MNTTQKYPLEWPVGYPRTKEPKRSQFKNPTLDKSVKNLIDEVSRLLYGRVQSRYDVEVVVSSNIPLRNDGMPRADYMKSAMKDKGVAVYFKKGDSDVVICCDEWDTVESNMHAVYRTIEALRSIERWGVSDFIQRSFNGFKALPQHASARAWWTVLGFERIPPTYDQVKTNFKLMAVKLHPDKNAADGEAFKEITEAHAAAKKHFGV